MKNAMCSLIKIYGLPSSGTNVLNFSLALNFHEPISGLDHHGIHYLGWKHGKPMDVKTVNLIEKSSNVSIKFVFIVRNFNDWKDSVINKHIGQHPFPFYSYLTRNEELLYETPNGFERYKNFKDLYDTYIQNYSDFISSNFENSILINYEDFQKGQEDSIIKIKEKFKLNMVYEKPIPIYKHVQMNERL